MMNMDDEDDEVGVGGMQIENDKEVISDSLDFPPE